MSSESTSSLANLPVELVYRILDNLELFDIMISTYNVCTRLNNIIDTYHPYQVEFTFTVLKKVSTRSLNIQKEHKGSVFVGYSICFD